MPRPRRGRKRNSQSPEWNAVSEFPVFTLSDFMPPGQPVPKRKRARRSNTTRTPKTTNNDSIIFLDDSDDECLSTVISRSKQISQNASDKVNDFFRNSGLMSDDEDECFQVSSSSTNRATDTNKPGVSGVSTSNADESVIVLEDDPNEITTVKEIQNYCKETDEILKNAKALLEKFSESKETEKQEPPEKAIEKSPEKKNEPAPRSIGECPICYDSFAEKQVMTTKCGHLFCKPCIEKVAITVKKCPTCRKQVTKKKQLKNHQKRKMNQHQDQ